MDAHEYVTDWTAEFTLIVDMTDHIANYQSELVSENSSLTMS